MKISVIVPAYNEEKLIGQTLAEIGTAAAAFGERGWDWEIVVCDNNSTDRTGELSRSAGARVVFEPVNQIGRARNTGAAAAAGDWLIFVDADSSPTRELFADVAGEIQRGHCLAGGTTLYLDHGHRMARLMTGFWNRISRMGKLMAGSFIFCDTAAFRELGGFDLNLYISEEIDLSRRLKRLASKQGKRIVILNRHPLRTSGRKLELYSAREHLKFMAGLVLSAGRAKHDPAQCQIWYDGRR